MIQGNGSGRLSCVLVDENLTAAFRIKAVLKKLAEYFANGTILAWVINPKDGTVAVHRSAQPPKLLRAGDSLNGEEVLPGFSFPAAQLFAEPEFGS